MKKKANLIIILLLAVTICQSQTLDGYKYVYVQTVTYQNGGIDIWGISNSLSKYFSAKGFIVLNENSTPPKELQQNPCLMFSCYIDHTSVINGTNKVTINLYDCNNFPIYTNTGSAMGMTLQDDYNKATKRAFSEINLMSYRFNPSKTPLPLLPKVEKLQETEESIKEYLLTNSLDPIEGIYKILQTDGMPYYKVGIIRHDNKFKAIILETDLSYWKVGEVKAIFEQSSMVGLYSAKWYMGDKTPFETFAKIEENAILSILLKDNKTGADRNDKFIKIFPTAIENNNENKNNTKTSGSGFFLTTTGIIATNAHVIKNAENIQVTITNEVGTFTYNAKVLLSDSKNDVALIQIIDENFKGLTTIPYSVVEKCDIGSKVFTIGYPLNDVMGSNFKVNDGIISANSGIDDDIRYYQISIPLQPGNSGGPLFNKEGDIIGITSLQLNSDAVGVKIENVNYAIKSSYLLSLYNMLPNAESLPEKSQLSALELEEQIKVLKNYVCLIKTF